MTLTHGLLSFKHLQMLQHTQDNIRNTQLHFVFLKFLFMCQSISACLKLKRPLLVIVYCYESTAGSGIRKLPKGEDKRVS